MINAIKVILAKWLLRSIYATCRWSIEGQERLDALVSQNKSVIIAVWHGRLLMPWISLGYLGYYALAGTHADAELISQISERMKWKMIRGSSSEGGLDAFKHIVKALKVSGSVLFITPDGPKGPALEPKPGTVKAAQLTGATILPVSAQSTRRWGFTNWDTFFVAQPFSRIEMIYGEPLFFSRDEHEADAQQRLKESLDSLSRVVDERVG